MDKRLFLIGRQQHVVLNDRSSAWMNVTSGVPQESVVGPLLFILYVNNITDGLQSTLEMFADDCKLYMVIKHLEMVFFPRLDGLPLPLPPALGVKVLDSWEYQQSVNYIIILEY